MKNKEKKESFSKEKGKNRWSSNARRKPKAAATTANDANAADNDHYAIQAATASAFNFKKG